MTANDEQYKRTLRTIRNTEKMLEDQIAKLLSAGVSEKAIEMRVCFIRAFLRDMHKEATAYKSLVGDNGEETYKKTVSQALEKFCEIRTEALEKFREVRTKLRFDPSFTEVEDLDTYISILINEMKLEYDNDWQVLNSMFEYFCESPYIPPCTPLTEIFYITTTALRGRKDRIREKPKLRKVMGGCGEGVTNYYLFVYDTPVGKLTSSSYIPDGTEATNEIMEMYFNKERNQHNGCLN